jgi:glycerophosphoryl diester phosphodiesterase
MFFAEIIRFQAVCKHYHKSDKFDGFFIYFTIYWIFISRNNIMEQKQNVPYKKRAIRIEGHRGAGFLHSENTVEAFKRGVALDLDGVEFDVPPFNTSNLPGFR